MQVSAASLVLVEIGGRFEWRQWRTGSAASLVSVRFRQVKQE